MNIARLCEPAERLDWYQHDFIENILDMIHYRSNNQPC